MRSTLSAERSGASDTITRGGASRRSKRTKRYRSRRATRAALGRIAAAVRTVHGSIARGEHIVPPGAKRLGMPQLGHLEQIGQRSTPSRQLGPADHPDPLVADRARQGVVQRTPRPRHRRRPVRLAGDRRCCADPAAGGTAAAATPRCAGPSRRAHRAVIAWKCARSSGRCQGMPPSRADDAVLGLRPDEPERGPRGHTATAPGCAGWCW